MKTAKKFSIILCSLALHQQIYSGHPNFIIIGAQKSGTTSLYNYLIQHPLISSATKKEIHYFNNRANFKKGSSWYSSHFPDVSFPHITGEATPMLSAPGGVPQKIKELYPNIKLIAILRDPVARAFSNYKMCVLKNLENEDFETALSLENKRERLAREKPRLLSYSLRGKYAQALKQWLKHFPKEQILVLIFEEFFANPQKSLNEVFKFLGLPEHTLKTYRQYHRSKLPNLKIKSNTEKKLKEFYRPYNQELETLLGRKLPWN